MTDAEPVSEIDRLRAFAARMQAEGAAGFADGPEPWSNWERPATDDNPAWERPRDPAPAETRTVCEKLMTGIASVATLALAIGIGGIWLTTERARTGDTIELARVDTTPPVTSTAPLPAAVIRRDTLPLPADSRDLLLEPAPALDALPGDSLALQANPDDLTPPATTAAPVETPVETPAERAPAMTDRNLAAIEALPAPTAGEHTAHATQPDTAPTQVALHTPATPATGDSAPAAAGTGPWTVNISAYADRTLALAKIEEFRTRGVNAELVPIDVNGTPMHRIRVAGYDSKREAITWVSLLEERLGIEGAWVSRR